MGVQRLYIVGMETEQHLRDRISFLEDWYAQQCDGDWEHEWGVEIATLDNPGWQVTINLEGTPWADRQQEREIHERTEHDWYHAWSDGHTWEASCGPQNLSEVLGRFRLFLAGPVEDVREEQESEPVDPRYRIRFEPPAQTGSPS